MTPDDSAAEGATGWRNGGRLLIQVVKSDEEGSAMSAIKAAFVLVHGGWHNHSVWDRVTPILEANGFSALTLDVPGAGANAIAPTSLRCSPFNPAAFAAERSPTGHYIRCTQDRAIPLTGQDHMIATVDSAIGGKTTTHTLESSHSPFLSQPATLSKMLIDICVQSLAEQSAQAP